MECFARPVGGERYQREPSDTDGDYVRFYWRGGGYFVVPDWSGCELSDRIAAVSTKRKARKLAKRMVGGARARRRFLREWRAYQSA